ncbi:MAG: vitamin K epoxide reductase family protein [Patescibacteria group bacterium]|jgi:uncharacterized membrane protein
METLKQTSPPPLPKIDKIGAIIFLLLGIIGFLDASYLTIEHYRGIIPVCTVVTGCGTVLISKYSTVGPVPLALLGVAYYSVIIFGALLFLDLKIIKILHLLSAYTFIGILASLYFLYLQIFVIQALCLYCLFSAATSTLLFINGVYIYKKTAL